MLMARSRIIVGVMNSQAIARSESPFMRRATRGGVASARPSAICAICDIGCLHRDVPAAPARRAGTASQGGTSLLDFAFFLEDGSPIFDQFVQSFLGRALIGHDIIVQALLHRL